MCLVVNVKGISVYVDKSGEGKQAVILLHGWGQSSNSFQNVRNFLKDAFTVYSVDLPGFGLSNKPDYPYNTQDYAEVLKGIIDEYRIQTPIIIGHSFGGRVAIKYTALFNQVKKLILIDSAGIVHKKPLTYYFKVYTFKFLRRLFSLPILNRYKKRVLRRFGSNDYKQADDLMKQVLVRVVNEDLRTDLPKIKCPTLLVWGTNDYVTPLKDAYIMKELIPDAGVVEIKGAGHFSYLDNLPYFLRVLDVFLKEDK